MSILVKNFLIMAALLSVVYGAVGGEYVREQEQNSLIYDPNPAPGEVAYWSGRVDRRGYATGFGVLTWFENGEKVSAYEGEKRQGRWIWMNKVDIGRSSNSARSEYVPRNSPPTPNREARSGTESQLGRAIPAFLIRDYPFVDTESAIVKTLNSAQNITEWGFQDLVASTGTTVVKVNLFRAQVFLELKQLADGREPYMGGDQRKESRLKEAFQAASARGGSPMIIVTLYLNDNGMRIESLPVTIEYYGGYSRARVDGSSNFGEKEIPFRLSDEVRHAVRRGETYALDPYDVRSVFSYSGMVSESGFDGIGYFTPLFLTDAETVWTKGKGYFGRFRSGDFVDTVSLESFGGPLAIDAQREAKERGALIGDLVGATLLGGMAIITGGAIKLGGIAGEAIREGNQSLIEESNRAEQANAYRCPRCEGYGKIDTTNPSQNFADRMLSGYVTCPRCDGTRWLKNGQPFKP